MRKGDYRTVTVDDVKFNVLLKWGDMKRIVKEYADVDDDDTNAQLELAEKTLLEHVVSIEGYEDEKGKPIKEISQEELDDFESDFITRLFRAVVGSDEAGGAGN